MCLFPRRRALGSFFCGGGFIPQPLQRRESSVDLVGRKSFWIEVVAKPCPAKNVWILLSERPIYRHSAGTVLPVAAVDPFSAGERASYYAPAGVLSRSSGILFNVKPNGDWLAVRYNDTKTTWRSGSSTMETASRIKFRDRSKAFMLDRNAWHELKMRVNGTDFKAWLDGNLALEHTPGTEPRRQKALRIQMVASTNSVLRLPVAGRLGLWAKTNSTSYFKDYVVTPLK